VKVAALLNRNFVWGLCTDWGIRISESNNQKKTSDEGRLFLFLAGNRYQ